MTKSEQIHQRMRSFDSLYSAWRAVQENARHSSSLDIAKEIEGFESNPPGRICKLSHALARGKFSFGSAKGAPIPKFDALGKAIEGKYRPIVIAKIEDRIIQRSLLETLTPLPELKAAINTPYSFGGIKKSAATGDSIAAVPAAIAAVLNAFERGGKFVVAADIRSFFTRIKRLNAAKKLSELIGADERLRLFVEEATHVELENLAKLTEANKHLLFPSFELGVAQGNSLSPLLGNLVLSDFDREMNKGDCNCIRYIDDFLIVAPTAKAASARLKKAKIILGELGMSLSEEKSSKAPVSISEKFEFLGIEMANGLIRPTPKKQNEFVNRIRNNFQDSLKEIGKLKANKRLDKNYSLVATIRRVDGMLSGWAKHYRFCNDQKVFKEIDTKVIALVRNYLAQYKKARLLRGTDTAFDLLGVEEIGSLELRPLKWPKNDN